MCDRKRAAKENCHTLASVSQPSGYVWIANTLNKCTIRQWQCSLCSALAEQIPQMSCTAILNIRPTTQSLYGCVNSDCFSLWISQQRNRLVVQCCVRTDSECSLSQTIFESKNIIQLCIILSARAYVALSFTDGVIIGQRQCVLSIRAHSYRNNKPKWLPMQMIGCRDRTKWITLLFICLFAKYIWLNLTYSHIYLCM